MLYIRIYIFCGSAFGEEALDAHFIHRYKENEDDHLTWEYKTKYRLDNIRKMQSLFYELCCLSVYCKIIATERYTPLERNPQHHILLPSSQ